MRLSKAGYGRTDEILNMNSELVLSMVEYENFTDVYKYEFVELNKEQ